jgi:tetratricopeptide (TPR) repeat protein
VSEARHESPAARGQAGGPAWGSIVVLALSLAVCAAALSTTTISGHDTWLHLAVGRHIAQAGAVPDADPFSHTRPGAPWVADGWLSSLLLYLAQRAGGLAALTVLRAAVVLSFVGGWLALCRGRPGAIWGVALLGAFALSMAPQFLIRPSLFSGALMIWQIALVDRALRSGRRRLLWLLPVLFAVWINLHSGAVAGWVFLAVYAGGLLLQTHLRSQEGWMEQADLGHLSRPDVRRLVTWVGVAGVAMVLNPRGTAAMLSPLQQFASGMHFGTEDTSTLVHLRTYGGPEFFNRVVMMALVVMVTWACALGRIHLGATGLMVLLCLLALWRIRNVVEFGLLAVALIGPPFGETVAASLRRVSRPRPPRRGKPLLGRLVTGALTALLLATAVICFPLGPDSRFGFGVDETRHPEAAIDFLGARRPATGEGFHRPEWGGSLLWLLGGQAKVYVDDRLEVYGREFFRNDYARVAQAHEQDPSWSQILEGHGVSWILIDQSDLATRPLVQALYRRQEAQAPDRRDWGLVWFDDKALIFFRRDAFDEATWDALALGFRADLAWMGEISAALLRVNPQWPERLVAMVEADPGNRLAVELLLASEQKLETFEWREFALEHLLTFDLTDEERARAEHALGMVHFRRGDREQALARLEAARTLSPDSLPIALDRAGVLWTLRREEETVAAYRAALEIDPSNAEAREALLEFEEGRLWRDHPSGATPPVAPEAPPAHGEDSEVVS